LPDAIPLRPAAEPAPPAAGTQVAPLLVAARQAAALCGVSVATWHRMNAARRCPAPLRLAAACVRWRAAELENWILAGCPSREMWEATENAAHANGRPRKVGR
jgi:predicted DNA-binding transcriptional regulator AlpA